MMYSLGPANSARPGARGGGEKPIGEKAGLQAERRPRLLQESPDAARSPVPARIRIYWIQTATAIAE
jgi:hypothetical protein